METLYYVQTNMFYQWLCLLNFKSLCHLQIQREIFNSTQIIFKQLEILQVNKIIFKSSKSQVTDKKYIHHNFKEFGEQWWWKSTIDLLHFIQFLLWWSTLKRFHWVIFEWMPISFIPWLNSHSIPYRKRFTYI